MCTVYISTGISQLIYGYNIDLGIAKDKKKEVSHLVALGGAFRTAWSLLGMYSLDQ